jgi:hypothetical protein
MALGKKKAPYRQQQLLYVGDDRVLTIQFTAEAETYPKFIDDVARIFASYRNVGVKRIDN